MAHKKWGDAWEMPSLLHYIEIFENCSKEKILVNDVKGMVYIGPNGSSIFFPAGGYRSPTGNIGANSNCDYWLSTRSEYNIDRARYMWLDFTTDTVFYADPCEGRLIRPIPVSRASVTASSVLSNFSFVP